MSGLFFDPASRRIFRVNTSPDPGWLLVTHNLGAGAYQCRRIMSEWLAPEELFAIDFSAIDEPGTLAA